MSDVNTAQINRGRKKKFEKRSWSPEAWKRPPSLASYRTEAQKMPRYVHASCDQSSHLLSDLVLSVFHSSSSTVLQAGHNSAQTKISLLLPSSYM